MYLEISPRQSGKTTRMIKYAIRLIRKGHSVLFVSISQRYIRHLSDQLVRQLSIKSDTPVITFTTYASYKKGNFKSTAYDFVLFDEFDFANVNKDFIVKNGYYSTTPRFIRSTKYIKDYMVKRLGGKKFDLLMELVIIKKYKFKTYFNAKSIHTCLNENFSYCDAFGSWRSKVVLGGSECCEYPVRETPIVIDSLT